MGGGGEGEVGCSISQHVSTLNRQADSFSRDSSLSITFYWFIQKYDDRSFSRILHTACMADREIHDFDIAKLTDYMHGSSMGTSAEATHKLRSVMKTYED